MGVGRTLTRMTATYTDIVDAMIEAREEGFSIDCAVLTSESMDSFLTNDKFTEEAEQRQKDTIGEGWKLPVESGDGNYLKLENGSRIQLE